MSKSQIIIIITGIVSVILLFNLPKIIVKSEKQLAEEQAASQKQAPADSHSPGMKDIHKVEISENEKNNIDNLRKSFLTVSNKEKKTNFADSLIKAFRKIHQYDSAAKYSEIVSEMKPGPLNWARTADILMEAADFAPLDDKQALNEKARGFYNKILDKDPGNLDIKTKLALTYVSGKNPMEAINLLREVVKTDPKNQSAIYNLGILSLQSGQHKKAVERFEDLLKINPNHSAGQFYLGVAWANLGDRDKALESFKKARELDTDPEFRATVDSYIKELQ
jgi:tetratricopeptide (TPR) repeat protein